MPKAIPPSRTAPENRVFRLERIIPAVTPIVVLALALIGYLAFVRPQLLELRSLALREAVASDAPQLEARLAHLTRVREAFAGELRAVQPIVDAVVPNDADVPGLYAAIDAAAQRAGVAVASVEVSREKPPPALDRVLQGNDVVLIGLGLRNVNYDRLKAFLGVIAQGRRLTDVLSVQFAPKRLTANLRIRAYTIE